MMLTGKTAHTRKAGTLGIADIVTEERHVAEAVRAVAAGEVAGKRPAVQGARFPLEPATDLPRGRCAARRAKNAPQEHYPAPYALIDIWEEHGGDPKAMQNAEIECFARLLDTETARNLIRVFFLRERLRDWPRGEAVSTMCTSSAQVRWAPTSPPGPP